MENLIHITFDRTGAENLRQSFDLDDIIAGEIVVLEDDLAFGPLKKRAAEPDRPSRREWWEKILNGEQYALLDQYNEKVIDLCQKMRGDEDNEIWIWAGQNTRDVCGYYALLPPLADFLGRVHLIYLNNLPFINEKGSIFYPAQLSEILPKEFLKARKLAREITPAELEMDGEEWQKLKEENAPVRLLEGGKKIGSRPDDYFDPELINRCRLGYIKAWRVVSQVQQKGKAYANESFLYWRLQVLVENGLLEIKEQTKNLRDSEVKMAGTAASDEPIIQEGDEQQES